jgi:hypothetical protein
VKHRLAHRTSTPRLQQGFALIAILALAALISAFLIASALNRSSADVSNEREQRSMDALRQAKAALIAYAASEEWQLYKSQTPNQPGGLPCPDINNNGASPGICSSASSRVGRLPYLTIGSDDLRDASGERLWYAVSSNFYKRTGVGGNVINSDTQGLLTVTGTAAANNVVAIVFAPGQAIQDSTLPGQIQDRSAANVNRPASYLEFYTPNSPDYTFTSRAFPDDTFNDRLLVITQAELMAAVEPVVAARIERDIVPNIQDYFSGWQAYPFPVPFNPVLAPQSTYQGDNSKTRGLLPVTQDPSFLKWDTSSITVSEIAGGTGDGAGSPPPAPPPYILDSPPDCSASTPSQIICKINYTGVETDDRPNIQVRANLLKAGLSFPKPYGIGDAMMTGSDGNLVPFNGPDWAYWSPMPPDPPWPNALPTVSHAVYSSGDGTVVFTGRLQNNGPPPGGTGGKVTITITLKYEPFTNPSDATVGWFVANEWHRQTYYAVSQGFLPGGGGACNAPAPFPCLTVNNLRPSYTPPNNNKQAIVLLTGRSLNGNPRPSTNLPDYFESANLTAANGTTLVYENRSGNPTTINDRVVVVSP